MMPKRIQRKRTKEWRMPENTISVTRPSIWGNPFKTAHEYRMAWEGFNGHSELVRWFRKHGWKGPVDKYTVRYYLKGKNLACWCKVQPSEHNRYPCHADVLLKIANP